MRSSTSFVLFNFLEFPQSCDSSIPLVAQELMRKMIQRFALEYACKSQAHEGLNGLSDTSELLPHQPDPDGPLDLTISRASQALQGNQVFFFFFIYGHQNSFHFKRPDSGVCSSEILDHC